MMNADVTRLLSYASSMNVMSITSFELSCNVIIEQSSQKFKNFDDIKFPQEHHWNLVNYPS